jgi:hypothetical protein
MSHARTVNHHAPLGCEAADPAAIAFNALSPTPRIDA